jgi:polyisoprenoid-binding protein YceI
MNEGPNMTYCISLMSSIRHGLIAIFHKGRRAVMAMTGAFFISGVLLIAGGCDRPPKETAPAVAESPGAIGGQKPSTAIPGTSVTDPSVVQYVSSADAGQALVLGTSTLHDWTVSSKTIKGTAQFSGPWKADASPAITLQSIDVVIPVDSLKSTEGAGMDNTMYEALKLKQFSDITYKLTKATLKTSPSKQDSAFHFDTVGELTVAGAIHQVNLDLGALPHGNGQLTITTNIGLKMTDFGVKPPTAMVFIKSGDAITVKATWELSVSTARSGK